MSRSKKSRPKKPVAIDEKKRESFREGARTLFQKEGVIEIDDAPEIRTAEDGAWVQAWVFCSNEDAWEDDGK